MKLVAETFTCSKAGNRVEFGFTFKRKPGDDDGVFDLVIGEVTVEGDGVTAKALRAAWRKYRPMARAIAKAGVVPPRKGMFFAGV